MVYAWKSAAQIRSDPQVAGAICERLEREGRLSARSLLEVSRPVSAPLHREFEWDDAVAAEQFRESQARHIINCLIVEAPEDTTPTRAFFQIEPSGNTYTSLTAIIRSPDKYQLMLAQAKSELQAFAKKYDSLKELKPIFNAIREMA